MCIVPNGREGEEIPLTPPGSFTHSLTMFPWRQVLLPSLGVLALLAGFRRFSFFLALRRTFADPLPGTFPYRAWTSLVTKNELLFYTALKQAVGARFVIATKVRLADIITCPRVAWSMGYGRLIAQKHVDFVICAPETLRIVLALEVDDLSHRRLNRRLRDRFVDRALKAAGVPLLRVQAATTYDPRELEHLLSTLPALRRERHRSLPWRKTVP